MIHPLKLLKSSTITAALLTCLISLASPLSAKSIALIIGNDNYAEVEDLRKAREDASGYQEYFERQGFEVFARTDLSTRDMSFELATFYDQIGPGDTVAFIYSGHGWSNGQENYLLPTDIRPEGSETLIAQESFVLRNGANGILDEIAARKPRLTIAVVDACRNNPFTSVNGTRSVGLTRGLVPVSAPSGTFVAFSAGENQTALDRLNDDDPEPYSVFTRHFLAKLDAHADLQSAFKATQLAVNTAAAGIGHPQRPAYYDEVIGQACLSGSCEPIRAQPQPEKAPVFVAAEKPDATRIAAEEWDDFEDTWSIEALEIFAKRHDGTAFAPLARERIRIIKLENAEKLAAAKAEEEIVVATATPAKQPNVENQRAVVPAETAQEGVEAPTTAAAAPAPKAVEEAEVASVPAPKEPDLPDTRPTVIAIQKRLNWHQCSAGSVDGALGPQTRRALARFSKATNKRVSTAPDRLEATLATLNSQKSPVCKPEPKPQQSIAQSLAGRWSFNVTCPRGHGHDFNGAFDAGATSWNVLEGSIWTGNTRGRFASKLQDNAMTMTVWWTNGARTSFWLQRTGTGRTYQGRTQDGCTIRAW